MSEIPTPDPSETGKDKEEKEFEESPIIKEDGWLFTGGLFIECEPEEHGEAAEYVVERLGYDLDDLKNEGRNPRTVLNEEGVIQMSKGVPILTGKSIARAQVEMFNKAGIKIPKIGTDLPIEVLEKFSEAYVGEFSIVEQNYIAEILSDDERRTTNIWDNEEVTLSLLSKITREMVPGKRVELHESHGGSAGTFVQYWVDKKNGFAIFHDHHIHDGQSAHYYDAPRCAERVRLMKPREAEKYFQSFLGFWEEKRHTLSEANVSPYQGEK